MSLQIGINKASWSPWVSALREFSVTYLTPAAAHTSSSCRAARGVLNHLPPGAQLLRYEKGFCATGSSKTNTVLVPFSRISETSLTLGLHAAASVHRRGDQISPSTECSSHLLRSVSMARFTYAWESLLEMARSGGPLRCNVSPSQGTATLKTMLVSGCGCKTSTAPAMSRSAAGRG